MKSIVGNTRVTDRVERMINSGRIPHAVMIEGERGLGKHTLARYIAKGAVCEGAVRPCGNCRMCHLADVGTHPDITVVSPDKKQLTVDKIRSVRQDAYVKSALSGRKVYIIENAETMNSSAQNALLKVLEEPPAGVIFILITLSADSMLPTVRSRAVTLSLIPPEHDTAVEYIASLGKYTAKEADEALSVTHGNIGLALERLDGRDKETYSAVAAGLIADINGAPAAEMLLRLKPFQKDRYAVDCILSELQLKTADLIKESCYTHIKEGLSREQLVKLYDIAGELRKKAAANVNTMLLFVNICSELKQL